MSELLLFFIVYALEYLTNYKFEKKSILRLRRKLKAKHNNNNQKINAFNLYID